MGVRFADGQSLAWSNIRDGLNGASEQLEREGLPAITVVSADRDLQLAIDIFLERYVLAARVAGRKVYDWRTWNGALYGRISPAGTVAVPSPTAPHVYGIAADLGAPYNARTHARARLVQICPSHGLTPAGESYGELWHFETTRGRGVRAATASAGSITIPNGPRPQIKIGALPMNYIRIVGKAGAYRGGTYAVFQASDGSYVSEFIGDGGPNNLRPVTDHGRIERLQQIIRGLA